MEAGYRAVKEKTPGSRTGNERRKQHERRRKHEVSIRPCAVRDPAHVQNIMHENRETSLTSEGDKPAERWVRFAETPT